MSLRCTGQREGHHHRPGVARFRSGRPAGILPRVEEGEQTRGARHANLHGRLCLGGRRATTHWRHAAALAARYPDVHVEADVPGEWLLTERLGRARTLLEETDLSVDEIAVQVGFGAAATLRNHFRTRLGTSPGYYRRRFSASGAH
nr:helix-turn-helix domain-containing protein [Cupriavidus necator]